MKADYLHIVAMIDAVEGLEECYAKGEDIFLYDRLTAAAAQRFYEVIGEASAQLTEPLKQRYPGPAWQKMKDLRNRIIHRYWGVDMRVLWVLRDTELPTLKSELNRIKQSLEKEQL